ncbi:hypothetical protein HYC85_013090 [Camellia sinensis]|uniref:HMA domain-containing protein n=1 Tax=Camellia sinensis TaxID=4442 RepID=A0A7J7HF21_CAMSI|nr:hypothetical protein HYC85_013090 [Camellia sinensis]
MRYHQKPYSPSISHQIVGVNVGNGEHVHFWEDVGRGKDYFLHCSLKIEVKVNIHCHKCKSNILKSSLNFKISVDSEKGILTVIGNVDPTRKVADLIGVGPPKAKEKRPDPPKFEPAKCIPDHCNEC